MSIVTKALRLAALRGIAIDTETTGLDITLARVIELAAVTLDGDQPGAERVDSSSCRHQVRAVMSHPPVFVSPETPLLDAMLRQQLRDLATGTPLSNRAVPATFDRVQTRRLRAAPGHLAIIATLVRDRLMG